MSYRPEDQSLEGPIDDILVGISNFREAVKKRMESEDFANKHTTEIDILSCELLKHERQLINIKKDTW